MSKRGYTLVELSTVLAILSLGVASVAPAAGRYREGALAREAREEVVGLIVRARAIAVAAGGATLHLDPAQARGWISTADTVLSATSFPEGVVLEGAGRGVALSFDALGLGRLASRTLVFRAGEAVARLSVSSYGRIRRW